MNKRGFASDNNAGVHPEILKAIEQVNEGHVVAYGDDKYTSQAISRLKDIFGQDTEAWFVFIGTAANVLGLSALTRSFHSIICAESSHIHNDECGAPEKWSGCKLLTVPTTDGKITVEGISRHYHDIDFEHHSQPRVISITQATEMGTVYSLEEIRMITGYAHSNNMLVHMDGARISNAAAGLNTGLKELTAGTGIDVLSFGGTKNGLMYGEAIIFFDRKFAENFKYLRKQGMQLASKMRFIAAQFDRYTRDDFWLKNARHANRMAKLLEDKVRSIPGVRITQKVEANAVFAAIPPEVIEPLQKEYFFYIWNESASEVRWMCSYDTTEEDVDSFAACIREKINRSANTYH
jgi:threonine aldolase